jgi:HK97 family phage major capsid protein
MTFETLDPAADARRKTLSASVETLYPEVAGIGHRERSFDLARMLNLLAEGRFNQSTCREAAVCRAAAIAQGRMYETPQAAVIPWGALYQRDLTATSAPSSGGNLVGAASAKPMDVLRPFSVTARMGLSTMQNLGANLLLPSIGTAATGQWLANESSSITDTTPSIGQVSSRPKTAGALIKASFQFMKQAATADEVIRQQLLGAMGQLLDAAVLNGSGASGQPIGLANVAGVNAQSGAVTHANMLTALETLANAKADDEKIKFLTTPTVRKALQARELVASTGVMLWSGNALVDKPAYVSTDVPAGTIFAGDWSQILVAFWGSGIEVQVDPYSSFTTGAIQVRVLMFVDVNFLRPAALLKHTSAS